MTAVQLNTLLSLDKCPSRDECAEEVLLSGEWLVLTLVRWGAPRPEAEPLWFEFYTLERPDDCSMRYFVIASDLGEHMVVTVDDVFGWPA